MEVESTDCISVNNISFEKKDNSKNDDFFSKASIINKQAFCECSTPFDIEIGKNKYKKIEKKKGDNFKFYYEAQKNQLKILEEFREIPSIQEYKDSNKEKRSNISKRKRSKSNKKEKTLNFKQISMDQYLSKRDN